MRFLLPLLLISLLTACSDAPTESKAPPKAPEQLTGRQAFQRTFPTARAWAADCQPFQVRTLVLESVKPEPGKAGAWEITYISMEKMQSRVFTWSTVDEDNLHEGVFGSQPQTWRGPTGQQRPFNIGAIKIDTPEALQAATTAAADYLKTPGDKPQINYLLEFTPRYPDPVWRVLWGVSVGSAVHSVQVDATTGKVLQQ